MDNIKNILVVLPSPMGDAILSTPALRDLRSAVPENTSFTYLALPVVRQVLEGVASDQDWITYQKNDLCGMVRELKGRKFDAAILMTNSFRAAFLVFLAGIGRRIGYRRQGRGVLLTNSLAVPCLEDGKVFPLAMGDYYLGLVNFVMQILGGDSSLAQEDTNYQLELCTSDQDRTHVQELFSQWAITPEDRLAILVPGGAFGPSKHWPWRRFAELADRLNQDSYQVILCCAPNKIEQEIAQKISEKTKAKLVNLAEKNISLGTLKECIRRCSVMIANDTGPCHIAAAFGVPLVTLFGPTDPRWTWTGYQREIRLRVEVDCAPCQEKTCREDHRCLESISVEQVYRAVQRVLEPPAKTDQKESHMIGNWFLPCEEQYVPLEKGRGLVHKAYQSVLRRNGLSNVNEVFSFQTGQKLIKPGLGRRERIKTTIDINGGKAVAVYIKRYGAASLMDRINAFVGSGVHGSELEFTATMRLAEKGIPVPRPIAYGHDKQGRSYLILEELPGGRSLEQLLPQASRYEKEYRLLKDKRTLIAEVAQLVRRFHHDGFCHRDLYLSHIFLCRNHDGQERLHLLDLQRVFRPRIFFSRWQVKDLAALYYSGGPFFSDSDAMRFLRLYLGCRSLNSKQKRLVRRVLKRTQRIARHDQRRGRTRPLPNPQEKKGE